MTNKLNMKFGSLAVHSGQKPDPHTSAVIPPISLSTTFKQSAIGEHKGFEYSRSGNPNRQFIEEAIASLENAKYGLAFSSGSAATGSIVNMLNSGAHIVCVNDTYGGTYRYFTKVATTKGMEVTMVDLEDPEKLKSVIKSNTKLVWIESPTNPTLRLIDIKRIAEITHEHKALLVVDNTFMTPYFQKPIDLGADVVVHSVTKYLNGHSDVVMGVAVTSHEAFYEDLKFQQNSFGAVPSPFDCFLAHRGLKTLHLRMKQHGSNALKVAEYLETSDKVKRVIYPGLPNHPQHELAKKQMSGFGGMVSVELKGDLNTSNKFLQKLNIFTLAESLGGIESLCELPSKMTHAAVSDEDRAALGISDTLIRLSVGIEEPEDLIDDIKQALTTL